MMPQIRGPHLHTAVFSSGILSNTPCAERVARSASARSNSTQAKSVMQVQLLQLCHTAMVTSGAHAKGRSHFVLTVIQLPDSRLQVAVLQVAIALLLVTSTVL